MDEYKDLGNDLEKELNQICLDVFLEKDENIVAEQIVKSNERLLGKEEKRKIIGIVIIIYLSFLIPILYAAKPIEHYLWFVAVIVLFFTLFVIYGMYILFDDNSKKSDDKICLTNKSIIYKFENKYKKVPFDDIDFIEIKKNRIIYNHEYLDMNIFFTYREFPDNVLGLEKDSLLYNELIKMLELKIYNK